MQTQENVSSIVDPRVALQEIEAELNELFLEREEHVRGLLCALVAGEHVIFIGPRGAAKSALVRALTRRLSGGDLNSGDYFYELMRPDSTADEIFGHYSITALGKDHFARKTRRYLPQARIAFIDEVPRGSSAILNGMLPILNEGIFKNDGMVFKTPLKLCVGAANTLPADIDDMAAFYDRWLVRLEVGYVSDANFISLLEKMDPAADNVTTTAADPSTSSTGVTCLGEAALDRAQLDARAVDATPVYEMLGRMRRYLREKGIDLSDRRFGGCIRLAKAQAYLAGHEKVQDDDLLILQHALWEHPEQRNDARSVVFKTAVPQLGAARNLLDEATELHLKAINAKDDEQIATAQEAHAKLKNIKNRLLDLREEMTASGKNPRGVDEILTAVNHMTEEILTECLGLDLGR